VGVNNSVLMLHFFIDQDSCPERFMAEVEVLKIGFQGARGAFSHRAGQIFGEQITNSSKLPSKIEFVPLHSFAEVFASVVKDECDFGAIPLENSSVGSIVANYDLLWKNNVVIDAEIMLPVQHQLLGFSGAKIEELESVYSHPVALDQCRKFFASMPNITPISYWDTSGAAFFVRDSGNPRCAAIASEFAAAESGLAILKHNIEDHAGNNTRFGIIRADSGVHILGIKNNGKTTANALSLAGPYKVSCAAEIAHRPGSLASLLSALAEIGANLTKIESRPIPEAPWHYRFFLDVELKSSAREEEFVHALAMNSEAFKVLGRYHNWSTATVATQKSENAILPE
jgi:prephenate dehydratase